MPGKHAQQRAAELQRILGILHKWGIHTIGQFAALNKDDLSVRLGPEAVQMWERANGKSKRILKLVRPPESFQENFEFENEIETAEPLLFMLRRFLEQLSMRLSGIYLVAKELTLRITFSNRRRYERCFKIPQPTNDVDLLFRMLQTHLENFKSEHAIIAVSLEAQPAKPAKQQFGLFEATLRNPQQLYETLARLTALLGTDRVGTPVLEETHRPDAFQMEPFAWRQNDEIRMSNDEGKEAGDLGPGLALRRVRPAAMASVFTSKHRHLQSEKIRGQILDQRGPYMLSGNWWDEKFWGRAEWDMQLENGELIRAYETEGDCRIEGVYD